MADLDLHREYNSSGECLQDLFDSREEGFFVPLYQREYTWEEDNINQLFDDLVMGVRELAKNKNATTFLGTTILTTLTDKRQTVKPGEERAQPTGVQIVIDGQQRISTLALISIKIIVKLSELVDSLPNEHPYLDIRNAALGEIESLVNMHTIALGRGSTPPKKPKIIWARRDLWTFDGDDGAYGSPVARYIATYIRTGDADTSLTQLNSLSGTRVRRNIALIGDWINAVCDAHIPGTNIYDQFPTGGDITSDPMLEYVLGYPDINVRAIVNLAERNNGHADYSVAAIYQLLLLTYYLRRRCGVNRLQPTHEDWGFDMFQSLNATGTPLTVMETFLPKVIQAERKVGNEWEKAPSSEFMDDVQRLFDITTTNEEKNGRTNELLGTFALCYEGQRLGNKFSEQRRWLTRVYGQDLATIDEKREFLKKLSLTANFFFFGWHMEEMEVAGHIKGLECRPDGDLASMLIRYLRDAHSNLSAPILAKFYSQALVDSSRVDEFIECAKACAAFFTLWRSTNSTSGLDEIYRKYFRGSSAPVNVDKHSWTGSTSFASVGDLRRYFVDILKSRGIQNKESWINSSERFLLYTELRTVCRFVLFIAGHDRDADDTRPGLTAGGTNSSCPLLELEKWISKDYRSIEHVAPQNRGAGRDWDPDIYAEGLAHQVGNLMLLPLDVNNLAGDKDWSMKHLYYSHVGETSSNKVEALAADAERKGIKLSKRAVRVLSKVRFNCTVRPVLRVGDSGAWNAKLIRDRTLQMKELAWDRLYSWLQP